MNSAQKLLVIAIAFAPIGAAAFPLGGPWLRDLDEGFYRSRQEQKNTLLVFRIEGQRSCTQLERELRESSDAKRVFDAMTPILLDVYDHADYARRRCVKSLPTSIVLDPQGRELDRIEGFFDLADYLASIDKAVDPAQNFRGKFGAARETHADHEQQRNWLKSLLERGMRDDGLEWINWLISKTPEEEVEWAQELEHLRVDFYIADLQWQKAADELDRFYAKYPRHESREDGYMLKANCLINLNDYEKARAVLKEFIEQFPTSPKVDEARKLIEYTF